MHRERVERVQATYLGTEIEVKDSVGVQIDGVEARFRAVDDLESLVLLYSQVDQQRSEMQGRKVLKWWKKKMFYVLNPELRREKDQAGRDGLETTTQSSA